MNFGDLRCRLAAACIIFLAGAARQEKINNDCLLCITNTADIVKKILNLNADLESVSFLKN